MGLPEPCYVDEAVILYQGDALTLLPELPASSVQLIIVDPPYYKVKMDYLGRPVHWDRQWPTRDAYLAWLRQLAKQWQRILTPNGSLYCFAAPQMAAYVEVMLSEIFEVIQRITWRKPPFATKAEMFVKEDLQSFFPVTEAILFYEQRDSTPSPFGQYIEDARKAQNLSRQDVSQFICGSPSGACWNWETGIRVPTKEHFTKLQQVFPGCFDRGYEALCADYEALRRPFTVSDAVPYTDVWDFATVPAGPGKHPAEKPLPLLRHMIEVSSRPGDLILDPCAGSGTTLEAARQCGRRAIGMELEPASCTLARQRLQQQTLW